MFPNRFSSTMKRAFKNVVIHCVFYRNFSVYRRIVNSMDVVPIKCMKIKIVRGLWDIFKWS